MDDYKPGVGYPIEGMQYRGYSDEGENKVNVARSSSIYEHMLR